MTDTIDAGAFDAPSGSSAQQPKFTSKGANTIKKAAKHLLHSAGLDIKRFRPGREEFLASRRIDTILDAGANIGQFGREVRNADFRGRIISFEPVRSAYRRLVETTRDDPLWTAHHLALSNRHGPASIHLFRDSTFSSLHSMTEAGASFGEDANPVGREEIALCRLEEFDNQIQGERLFLKIDTQGHERQVLEGAGRVLDRIYGIQLELPIAKLYEESWTISEGMTFMAELGFVPTHFRPNNFHPKDPIAIFDVDCIFRRRDPAIDG